VKLIDLFTKQKGVCWLCDKSMNLDAASRDHIVPKSKGGRGGYQNLRLAHRLCNSLRGSIDAALAREYVRDRLGGRDISRYRVRRSDEEVVISVYGYVERRKGDQWSITIPVVTKGFTGNSSQ
jgi:hypothetical protein